MSKSRSSSIVPAQPEFVLKIPPPTWSGVDFADVRGQEAVKRALTVALCGNHSVTLIGPHGCGKTMFQWAVHTLTAPAPGNEMIIRRATPDNLANENLATTDIHIEVPPVPFRELTGRAPGTSSAHIRKVMEGVKIWREGKSAGGVQHGTDYTLSEGVLMLAKQAFDELQFTPASFYAAVRVARTIADMDLSERIQEMHLAESVQYRLLDRHVKEQQTLAQKVTELENRLDALERKVE